MAVATCLRRQGHAALMLWALADNTPARRFYELLGGELLRERVVELRGAPVREVAYGWADIARLASVDGDAEWFRPHQEVGHRRRGRDDREAEFVPGKPGRVR